MGGTMEYPRIRARNGLNDRRMTGDPYNLGSRAPDVSAIPHEERTIKTDYLQGEMNRMEQSYLGVYADFGDYLPDQGAKVTGLTRNQILAVMRWFFGVREPYCEECAKTTHPIHQRCPLHATGVGLGRKEV